MRRFRFAAALLTTAVGAALVIGPAATTSAHKSPTTGDSFGKVPIHGHVEGTEKTFKGTMNVKRFEVQEGELVVIARISGELRNAKGRVVDSVDGARRTLPVSSIGTNSTVSSGASAQAAVCDVLHLELGPLDLDLLGLVVHLNRIVLDIDAVSGPGNLLGNLICAIAGLLDAPNFNDLLGVVADILNAIIGVLKL